MFGDAWWRWVLLVCWRCSTKFLRRAWIVLCLLDKLGKEYLSKNIIIDTVVEPASYIGDSDINALFLPFGCNPANMVVEVVEELGRCLLKVIERQPLKQESMCLDIVSVNGKSV